MMNYAQVIVKAKNLGLNDEEATDFARRVVTAAAMMAVLPEDVLQAWNERNENQSETHPLVEVMEGLEIGTNQAADPVLAK
ncbi:MAG: hypothetical protein IJK97_12150 [Thermoguttaceae bacterium]|nr:hypothetical protein [Thermoguttaceae bacterium]MBR0190729.1 hypothetical protein [Thermoguttaceae bacterium]